jgi:signal transduction histidine kinase
MRRRLLVTYLTLLAAALVGLCAPLALAVAARDAQEVFIDRQGDTARFASLAEPALRAGDNTLLRAEMLRYDQMFHIAVLVFGRDGRPVLASRAGLSTVDPTVREQVDAALFGTRAGDDSVMWPWRGQPLLVAEPVRGGGEIIGAVLTVSPTAALHRAIWRTWALIAGLSLVVLVAGVAATAPLSRWTLRPVRELDEAAHALSAGRFGDRVGVRSGPPELRRLAASFDTMSARIAGLVARQRSFVSYASHQLRTPLATLRLWVDNLRPHVAPDGIDDHRMVSEEIERMGRMCDALLAYARAEATAGDARDVDAVAVADARAAVWRDAFRQAGVRLVRAGEQHAVVRAAEQALDQALDALLSNAVKFAGSGAEVRVTVCHADDGWVHIDVADTGPGLPAEDLAHAAEPFWRRATDQNVDGSGLGVTIADALVTASGGRLDLAQAQPHGVRARIRLPAGRSE